MTKWWLSGAALFVLTHPLPAQAGWLLVQEMTTKAGDQPARIVHTKAYLGDGKLRREMESGGQKTTVLFDGDAMYVCHPTPGKTPGVCLKTLGDGIAATIESLHNSGAKVRFKKYAIAPTGGSRTIAGKACREQKITSEVAASMMGVVEVDTKSTETTCYADFGAMGSLGPKLVSRLEKLMGAMLDKTTREAVLKAKALGTPLATSRREVVRSVSMGKAHVQNVSEDVRTISISSVATPASLFAVPAGYAVQDAEKLAPRMAPPGAVPPGGMPRTGE